MVTGANLIWRLNQESVEGTDEWSLSRRVIAIIFIMSNACQHVRGVCVCGGCMLHWCIFMCTCKGYTVYVHYYLFHVRLKHYQICTLKLLIVMSFKL